MLNPEEVEYNATSLISTWLYKVKKVQDLRLVLRGENKEDIIPCEIGNAGKKLADILCNNNTKYAIVKLIGVTPQGEQTLGELDIN